MAFCTSLKICRALCMYALGDGGCDVPGKNLRIDEIDPGIKVWADKGRMTRLKPGSKVR